jgi:hypothetical protein
MRHSLLTLRGPTVNRNGKLSLSAGSLDESGQQRMIATAKGDVLASGHGEFLDVEGRPGLVVAEEQIPGPFVRASIPLHCSGRGRSNITMSGS